MPKFRTVEDPDSVEVSFSGYETMRVTATWFIQQSQLSRDAEGNLAIGPYVVPVERKPLVRKPRAKRPTKRKAKR